MMNRFFPLMIVIWIASFCFLPLSPAFSTASTLEFTQQQGMNNRIDVLLDQLAPNTPTDHIGEWIYVDTFEDTNDLQVDDVCSDQQGYCSLRAAIECANLWNGGQTIVLQDIGEYTLTILGARENAALTGDLDITEQLTITGAAPYLTVINANQIDRVFHIQAGADVKLENLGIKNGKPPATDPTGMYAWERYGGGIFNAGTLELNQVYIYQNTTADVGLTDLDGTFGGGVYSQGAITINNSEITNNTTADGYSGGTEGNKGGNGAGLYLAGASSIIMNSNISHNQTGDGGDGLSSTNSYGGWGGMGAGIYSLGTSLVIEDSVIEFNVTGDGGDGFGTRPGSVGGPGAGIHISSGNVTIARTLIADNLTGQGGAGCMDNFYVDYCKGGSGAGIQVNNSVLNLDQVSIVQNQNGPAGGESARGASGGGISASGSTLNIIYSDILENYSGNASDGVLVGNTGGHGGGLYADTSSLTISRTTIKGNYAGNSSFGSTSSGVGGSGGGIYTTGAVVLNFNEISVVDNHAGNGPPAGGGAGGNGGGLYLSSSATIESSVIANNHAGDAYGASGIGGRVGGVYIYGGGALTFLNCTISGNASGAAETYNGSYGGFFNDGIINLLSSTVTQNQTLGYSGAGYAGNLVAQNSIIANNTALKGNNDCSSVYSQGYNLIEDVSDCAITNDTVTNILGVDPALGDLQLVDSHFLMHPLLETSLAIDGANPAAPGSGGFACPANDGRLAPRVDFRCDIGAFEATHDDLTVITRQLTTGIPVTFGPLLTSITLQSENPITVTVEKSVELQQEAAYLEGSLDTYWRISETPEINQMSPDENNTDLLLDLTFCYTDEELGEANEDSLVLVFWDGLSWIEQSAVFDPDTNCVTQSNVLELGIWSIYTPQDVLQRIFLPLIAKPDPG